MPRLEPYTLLQLDLCAEEMHNSHPVAVALQGDIQVSLRHGLNNYIDNKALWVNWKHLPATSICGFARQLGGGGLVVIVNGQFHILNRDWAKEISFVYYILPGTSGLASKPASDYTLCWPHQDNSKQSWVCWQAMIYN